MKKIIVMSDAAQKNDILLACLKVFFPECEVEIRLKNDKATMDRYFASSNALGRPLNLKMPANILIVDDQSIARFPLKAFSIRFSSLFLLVSHNSNLLLTSF